VTRVEQPGNALQESAAYTDPQQLLFKMRQCGETPEQYFRDQCAKTRRCLLQPERVDLDYTLITYWQQQTEDMQEQTTRMRLEIMRETHAEIEDICSLACMVKVKMVGTGIFKRNHHHQAVG